MIRFIVFLIACAAVTFAFWLGGYDFNDRGWVAVTWFLACWMFGLMAISYPENYPGEKK